jgi:hypothetical protein
MPWESATVVALRPGFLDVGGLDVGSCETGSFDPDATPGTIWLEDPVPAVDPDRWRLTIVDDAGRTS